MNIDILDLVKQDGVKLEHMSNTHGGEYIGACPICGGRDRFHAWPLQNDGTYWCRGCGSGGDAISYLRNVHKCSYVQACARLGVNIEHANTNEPKSIRKFVPRNICLENAEWRTKCNSLAKWANEKLMNNKKMLDVILHERGINESTINKLMIGYNPLSLTRKREQWGLEQKLRPNGTEYGIWIPEGITIPHFIDEEIHRVRIRCTHAVKGSKYIVVSGSDSSQMVIGNTDGNCFSSIIVESELDAILISQVLSENNITDMVVIGIGSAQARPDVRVHDILTRSAEVLVALDNDINREDGLNPGEKESVWMIEHYVNSRRLRPSDGYKDPGEMFTNGISILDWILNNSIDSDVKKAESFINIKSDPMEDFTRMLEFINDRTNKGGFNEESLSRISSYEKDLQDTWDLYNAGRVDLKSLKKIMLLWFDAWKNEF